MSTVTAAVLVSFQNCSPVSNGSRGPAGIEMQQQTGGTTTDNPKPTVQVSIMPHSVAAVGELTICVEDVRFKRESVQTLGGHSFRTNSVGDNDLRKAGKDLARKLRGRDITIVKEGTFIDAFSLPRGDYNVVELILDDECEADKSLTVRTAHGALSTKERVTLRFDGNGRAAGTEALQLNMHSILEALTNIQTGGEIRRTLEAARGNF